jgi:hypothetical protein
MSDSATMHSLRTDLRWALGSCLWLVATYEAVSNLAQGGSRKNTITLFLPDRAVIQSSKRMDVANKAV